MIAELAGQQLLTDIASVGGAYLATSPGGFNAVVALSGGTGAEAPMVMVYHLVRIYAIVLLSPFVGKLLTSMVK